MNINNKKKIISKKQEENDITDVIDVKIDTNKIESIKPITNTKEKTGIEILMDVNSRVIKWSDQLHRFYSRDSEFINAIRTNKKHYIMEVWISTNDPNVENILSELNPPIKWNQYEGERLPEPSNEPEQKSIKKKKNCFCSIS